jgi:hypothetical protein
MEVHICSPGTQEAEAGKSQVQDQPKLHSEFKASLGYIARPCLKKTKQNVYTKKNR